MLSKALRNSSSYQHSKLRVFARPIDCQRLGIGNSSCSRLDLAIGHLSVLHKRLPVLGGERNGGVSFKRLLSGSESYLVLQRHVSSSSAFSLSSQSSEVEFEV